MKKVLVFLILFCLLGVASGLAQMPDTLKPKADSAAGDTLAKKNYLLCPKCGRANYPEANYCIYCGEPLKPGLERKPKGEREGQTRPLLPRPKREDPNLTRLYFVPTGETLKRGKGYLGVAGTLIPTFSDSPNEPSVVAVTFLQGGVGITDNITLFVGDFTAIPGHLDWQWIVSGPKIRILKRGNTSVAIGGVGAFNSHFDVLPWAIYGVSTFGKPTGRLNLGLGKLGEGTGPTSPWIFTAGGEAGSSNRSRWLWESIIWQREVSEFSPNGYMVGKKVYEYPTFLGLRFFGQNFSGDLVLLYPWSTEEGRTWWIGWPMVSLAYHFK